MYLVFSDSHGDLQAIQEMLAYEKDYQAIFCGGDLGFDIDFIEEHQMIAVRGNYPFAPKVPYDIIQEINQVRILITHGHKYRVKGGMYRLKQYCQEQSIDLCIFGHTHQRLLKKIDQTIYLNPGALSYSRSSRFPSYARLSINQGIRIEIIDLVSKKVVIDYEVTDERK